MSRHQDSLFRIEPDPPIAGAPLEITYSGKAREFEIQVDGKPPLRVKPDGKGKYRLTAVPAGEFLYLDDMKGYPGVLVSPIKELG